MNELPESRFIREKLHGGNESALTRYRRLIVGDSSLIALLRLELVTGLLGWIPGAAGLFLRKLVYPSLFAACGNGVVFGRQVVIRNPGNIRIGSGVTIDDYALLDGRGADGDGFVIGDRVFVGRYCILHSKVGELTIGSDVNIGTSTVIVAQGGIRIGAGTQIAGNCKISGGLFRYDREAPSETPFVRYSNGPIVIEESCFLGGGVHVSDGITIGRCSMIGTGGIVMSDIPPYSIYMPRPGMVMGTTVPEEDR